MPTHWSRVTQLWKQANAAAADTVPDAELLRRFVQSRDAAAFELLVWRYGAMVLGVCKRSIRDEHLAHDAFQATFFVLARKAGSIRGRNLAGWLFRVARRSASRVRPSFSERPLTTEPITPPQVDILESRELQAILDEEIARLPERFRLPVLLHYLGGKSTEETAHALGCPRGTILSRLATGRQKLAARLTRRGVTLPAIGLGVGATMPAVAESAMRSTPDLVRIAISILAGKASTAPAFLLSQQLVRSMTLVKVTTVAGIVIMFAGLGTGVGVWSEGGKNTMGLAAAADSPPKPTEPAKPAGPPTANAPIESKIQRLNLAYKITGMDIIEKTNELQKLKEARKTVVDIKALEAALSEVDASILKMEKSIESYKKQLASAKDRLAHPDKILITELPLPEKPSSLKYTVNYHINHDPAREYLLKVAGYRDIYKKYEHLRASPILQALPPDDPRVVAYLKKMEEAFKEIDAARTAALPQAEKYYREERLAKSQEWVVDASRKIEGNEKTMASLVTERIRWVDRIEEAKRSMASIHRLEDDLKIFWEFERMIRRELWIERVGLDGIAMTPITPKADYDPRMEQLLREMAEMRKELADLKKK